MTNKIYFSRVIQQTNKLPPALKNESADPRFGIQTTPQNFQRQICGGFTWNVPGVFLMNDRRSEAQTRNKNKRKEEDVMFQKIKF